MLDRVEQGEWVGCVGFGVGGLLRWLTCLVDGQVSEGIDHTHGEHSSVRCVRNIGVQVLVLGFLGDRQIAPRARGASFSGTCGDYQGNNEKAAVWEGGEWHLYGPFYLPPVCP